MLRLHPLRVLPCVLGRDYGVLCENAVHVNAEDLCVLAHVIAVVPAGVALSADDVGLGAYVVANFKGVNTRADFDDFTGDLMSHDLGGFYP